MAGGVAERTTPNRFAAENCDSCSRNGTALVGFGTAAECDSAKLLRRLVQLPLMTFRSVLASTSAVNGF